MQPGAQGPAGLGYSHGVVVWLPALQLLEAQETLGQVGLILGGAVDEAGRGHLQGRARLRPRRGAARVPGAHGGASRRPGSEVRRGAREAPQSHLFRGAGAALQEGPVLERSEAVVLEEGLPGLRQRRGAHLTATPPAPGSSVPIQIRRLAAAEKQVRNAPLLNG